MGTELVSWLRRHWVHLLLSPLVFVSFTVIHETVHALAAYGQGGTITDFSVLPSGGNLGHMSYQFPEGSYASRELVSVAPYLVWSLCMLAVLLLSFRSKGYSFAVASTLFVWGFLGAWGDIALAGVSWIHAGSGDWAQVLGPSTSLDGVALIGASVLVLCLGYWVQRRLYRDGALGVASYGLIMSAASVVILVGTSVLR